jgi:hypothetical protein
MAANMPAAWRLLGLALATSRTQQARPWPPAAANEQKKITL